MKKLSTLLLMVIISTALFSQVQTRVDEIEYDKRIKLYFIVELIPNLEVKVDPAERMSIQKAHMQNIHQLVLDKKLVMAGPFQTGGGLFFMNVANKKEAEELIKNDPTIISEINTYSIRPWMTERGLFTLDNNTN